MKKVCFFLVVSTLFATDCDQDVQDSELIAAQRHLQLIEEKKAAKEKKCADEKESLCIPEKEKKAEADKVKDAPTPLDEKRSS